MNESNKTFRDKLLDMEKSSDNYKKKYEKEVKEMVEKKLTGLTKLAHIVGLIMGLGFATLFGTLAVTAPKEFPLWGRFTWGIGAVGGLAIIAVEASILRKGAVNLKTDEMVIAKLPWCFLVIIGTILLVFSGRVSDPIKAVHMLVSFLFFFIMATVFMVQAFVQRSELNTREKLLEIEYRLAELAEKIENKHSE